MNLEELIKQNAEELQKMCHWYTIIKQSIHYNNESNQKWCSRKGLIMLYNVPKKEQIYFFEALSLLHFGQITGQRINTLNDKQGGVFYLLPEFKQEYQEKIKEIQKNINYKMQNCEICGEPIYHNSRYRWCSACRKQGKKEQQKKWYINKKIKEKQKNAK